MIKIIADVDPGRIYRVVGKTKSITKAVEIQSKFRLEFGPTISVQLLNTGEPIERPFNFTKESSVEKPKRDKTTQFKGL